MTLEISAEKRRLASLTRGWFSASSVALPAAAARFFFGAAAAGVPGRSVSLRFGCDWRSVAVRMRLASALKSGGEHCFGDGGLDLESVAGEGEGRVVDGVGGGLLAFDGGEGGGEGGLQGVEVDGW